MKTSDPITNLINALSRLPGIGERTASRLAFHILNQPDDLARELAEALVEVKARVGLCVVCCNLTEEEHCVICRNPKRDMSKICVVETTPNLRAIENTGEYRGSYHVGPDDLHVAELLRRLQGGEDAQGVVVPVEEVILATSPSVDGEATALYLSRLLKPTGMKITRIASGVPIGADLEYADRMTLSRAMLERRTL
jgi:recombination protein RecR